MSVTTGTFRTPNAAKYIAQLCKHFAHKTTAEYDETSGRVDLPCGPAIMTATPDMLTVRIELTAPDQLKRGRMIIDKHLERFAFREDFKAMEWDNAPS